MNAELILKLANLNKETVYAIVDYISLEINLLDMDSNPEDSIRAAELQKLRTTLFKLIGDDELPF